MRRPIKAMLGAIAALGALATVGACAQPYYYGPYDPYGPPPGPAYYGAYPACDPYWGCPDGYYADPYFDGEIFYDGGWLAGPFFYRDWGGGRQYWIHGGWRYAQGRGGHYRAPLGRGWYQSHQPPLGFSHGNGWGHGWQGRGYGGHGFQPPQAQPQPQGQPQIRGGGDHGGRGGDHGWRR